MVFTHRNFYTQKLLHREVFAQRRLDMKSQVEIGSSSSGKTLGRSFRALTCSPKKPSISNKVPVLFFFKKREEYISEAGPHPKAFQPPHCDEMEGREIRRSRRGALALKSGQGPPGRGIAEGGSLLSVGERGRRPSRRPPRVAKNCRVLRCFVLVAFFPIFRILWFKMGQHGPR